MNHSPRSEVILSAVAACPATNTTDPALVAVELCQASIVEYLHFAGFSAAAEAIGHLIQDCGRAEYIAHTATAWAPFGGMPAYREHANEVRAALNGGAR